MSEPCISPQRLDQVKASIHAYLSDSDIYSSIREIVNTYTTDNPGAPIDDPDPIMSILKERGVIQSLLSTISTNKITKTTPNRWNLSDGEKYLHIRLNGGRAFVDNIENNTCRYASMYVGIHFGSQRFHSASLPCLCEPKFDDDFLLHLDPGLFGHGPNDLIEISTPVHLAVFREDATKNVSELVGENVIDWRKVLRTGFLGVTVELCGANAGIPAGILDLQLELVPHQRTGYYTDDEVAVRLEQQRDTVTSSDREFLMYARRWWNEYQKFRPSHKQRKVKVFASTTNGRMVPVTHFVTPTQGDGLSSPLDAARFVSLLQTNETHEDDGMLEGSSSNQWLSSFIFISQRQGHQCNHANLLCSLLIGFGLDAYCCIGTDSQSKMIMYVISHVACGEVIVWVPSTGEHFPVNCASSINTIDCAYNHKSFYANCQQNAKLSSSLFDFENEEYWKPLNPLKLRLVPKFPNASLLYEQMDLTSLEKGLELRLRTLVVSHRDVLGVQTTFDEHLPYVFSQALQNYEEQKVKCQKVDFSLFQSCIKGIVGSGMTFKALPINVTSEDENKIMNVLLSCNAGTNIINAIGDNVKLGIRVKIFPYPESVRSVWIMFGVAYRITI